MNLHLTYASTNDTVASVAAVAPDLPNPRLGQLYAVVVSHSPSISGSEVFEYLKQKYFFSESSAFEALRTSLKQTTDYFAQRDGVIDISALVHLGNVAYIAVVGNGIIHLKRDGRLILLAQSPTKTSHLGSGKIQLEDEFSLTIEGNSVSLTISVAHPPRVSATSKIKRNAVNAIDALLRYLPATDGIKINNPALDVKVHKQRKYAVVIGIILVLLLGLSVVIGMKRNEYLQKKNAQKTELESVRQILEEARSVKDLSRERARSLLLQARDGILALQASNPNDPEVELVARSVDDSLGSIAGLYKNTPELFLDLSLISNGFKADALHFSANWILVLDKQSQKLAKIDASTKKTEIVAGPDSLGSASEIAAYESRIFSLSDQGVLELTSNKKKVLSKDWEGEALIFAFAGNMYVLDKNVSQIYRYPGTIDGFGGRSNWLATDVSVNLSKSISWAIDGSIWVLSDSGKISKFSLGKVDSFVVGVDNPITAFYTDEETEHLYLLDSENGKIIILDKKGQFQSEYEHELLKGAVDFIVDSANRKMIVATGDKLFALEIRHL